MPRLEELPCSLPASTIANDVDPVLIARQFERCFKKLNASYLQHDAVWRDLLALTGTLRTFYGGDITPTWGKRVSAVQAGSFSLQPESCRIVRLADDAQWIEASYSFQTKAAPCANCTAILSLVSDVKVGWRIWVLRTMLENFEGEGDVDSYDPPKSLTKKLCHDHSQTKFDCIVVGGGQSGLSTAGRLQALGVSYVVLEQNAHVGDNWANRYASARLHTPREYGHLPFDRTFPESYQEFLTKDDLAKGYQDWVNKFQINVRVRTALVSASWDEETKKWKLKVSQNGDMSSLTCSFLVMAFGAGCQTPVIPYYADKNKFKGTTVHSGEYIDASKWKNKRGVVIGTANTAHDVAADMLDAGLTEVTMIQRSPTCKFGTDEVLAHCLVIRSFGLHRSLIANAQADVLPAEYYKRMVEKSYNSSVPTHIADKMGNSTPFAINRLINMKALNAMAHQEPERFDALEKAGFKTIRYGDIVHQLYERFGGHYMDVGCSDKIAKGLIKMRSDALPVSYTATGLNFSDGSHLPADVIVFATGFVSNMRLSAKVLLGDAIVDQLQDFWGLDNEGEIQGAFKTCGHPALWFHGGTLGVSRYYSRFIALQIKAAVMGSPMSATCYME